MDFDLLDLGEDLPSLQEFSPEVSVLDQSIRSDPIPRPIFAPATQKNPFPFKTDKSAAKKATTELQENEVTALRFLSLSTISNVFNRPNYKLLRYIARRAANLTSLGQQSGLASTKDDPETDCERNILTYICKLQPVSNRFYGEIS